MSDSRAPGPRDQEESPFSAILEGFWRNQDTLLCALFVDDEGECIDYFGSLDPFDAKVAGAAMIAVVDGLDAPCERAGMGRLRTCMIEAERRDLVFARVSDDYALVLVVEPGGITQRVLEALDALVEAFAREAGVASFAPPAVGVEMAQVEPGRYAPAVVHLPDASYAVQDLLASWAEPGVLSPHPRRCFRVRLETGDTLTLVHDARLGSYRIRRAPGGSD